MVNYIGSSSLGEGVSFFVVGGREGCSIEVVDGLVLKIASSVGPGGSIFIKFSNSPKGYFFFFKVGSGEKLGEAHKTIS